MWYEPDRPFLRDDFRMISELGFNFVRLPMDYRIWIKDGDWNQINEAAFADIDQAIQYGAEYGIHVCLNFHRAPGYTVAKPAEARSIWIDPEVQKVCAAHWAYFARRYKGIPNERLSFDLMNEPGKIAPETYRAVVKQLVEAIHREDPARLVIADGLAWGIQPCPELADLGIAQATRGYTPMNVSHYQASWIGGGLEMGEPFWPMPMVSSVLKGPGKDEPPKVIQITGPFTHPASLRVVVDRVKTTGQEKPHCELLIKADGSPLLRQTWEGQGELKPNQTLTVQIPAGTKTVELSVTQGWAILHSLGITPQAGATAPGREFVLGPWEDWNISSVPVHFDPTDEQQPFKATACFDRNWLQKKAIAPWKALEAQGVGIVVGEWGVYNKTPHPVVLSFMRDCLENWQKAGWGWALWNFRGGFGVLDSERADVHYENFHGHKLDREMLDLLRKY